MIFEQVDNRLVLTTDGRQIWIEPWGENSLRVRESAAIGQPMDTNDWALTEPVAATDSTILIEEVAVCEPWYRGTQEEAAHTRTMTKASLTNGKITAKVNIEGWISFYNDRGERILAEYWRDRDRIDRYCVPLKYPARQFRSIMGTSEYRLTMDFEANDSEHIYGMGQYQDGHFDKKGQFLELAQRNSQASVPFYISTLGYGFLWNNPAIGSVAFGTNRTQWIAESTKKLDYYITVGDTPAQIMEQYTKATGRAPRMPEYGLGFWQCKLRYQNQEELLNVARRHKEMGLPMDVIVIDFFHWTKQGDFRFDPVDWPDPEAMCRELKELGVELMVSVWPTVDSSSENYGPMKDRGYLVTCDRGVDVHMNWMGEVLFFDATNPGSREYVWECCKKNYYDKGVRLFWLDEAEPEYGPYDFDNNRYSIGSALSVSNIYPSMYAKGFFDGMKKEGQEEIVNLLRCAWAGSQKYGVLAWSGDVHSSFRSLQEQLQAGLSMGMAGIPWWTTDIGGFLGGMPGDESFRELLIRWFEWGCFCPVFRLHGERQPFKPLTEEFRNGVRMFSSGQDNEIWSYGPEVQQIMIRYLKLRERLRPYIREIMDETSRTGEPIIRPMYFDFPYDPGCGGDSSLNISATQYMFGPDLLVAPVLQADARHVSVYLPVGECWIDAYSQQIYTGGEVVSVPAPLDTIPVFIRQSSSKMASLCLAFDEKMDL